jgi:hypothetical protein
MLLPSPVVLHALGPVSGASVFAQVGRYSQTTCLSAAACQQRSRSAPAHLQIPLVDGGEFGRGALANT